MAKKNNEQKLQSYFNNKELSRNENNPRVYINNDSSLSFIEEILNNKSLDPEIIKCVRYDAAPFSRVCLVPLFDVHSAGEGSLHDRFKAALSFTNNTSNAITFTGGDLFDNATLEGATNAHTAKINPIKAMDIVCKCTEETIKRGKLVAVIGGNHDSESGSRNKDSNASPAKEFADRTKVPYVPFGMLLAIDLKIEGTNQTKPSYIYAFHGSGKSGSSAAAIDVTYKQAMNVLRKNGIIPDLIIAGHFHAGVNGVALEKYPVYDKTGKLVELKRKEIPVISANTLQGSTTYGGANNMSPSETNVFAVEIGWKPNPYYKPRTNKKEEGFVREENEYILDVCKFPVLKRNGCEFSTPAKDYFKLAYPDKTEEITQNIYKKYHNAPLTQVLHKFAPNGGRSQ